MDNPIKPDTAISVTEIKNLAKEKPVYEVSHREWILTALALGLGILWADLMCGIVWVIPAFGVTVGTLAWYVVLLWYVGPKRLVQSHTRLLFVGILLLSATFTLFSNAWFCFMNTGALLMLMTVHAVQLSGVPCKPWYLPSMLWERFRLLLNGAFGQLGALGAVGKSMRVATTRRGMILFTGVAVTIPLVLVAAWLLSQADALFQHIAGGIFDVIAYHLDGVLLRVIPGLLVAPFLFSLLYTLGRPKPLAKQKERVILTLDWLVPVMALGALDVLYLLFMGVQSAALFGGAQYLQQMGISYAEYARSGFFQLVFVTIFNVTILMTAIQVIKREGSGWRMIQILGTALVALSVMILVSAAWRMTLYVMTYGLSFKRALTYWGMAMMGLFLALACMKVWRASFSFFKVAAVAALVGWLVLNYANVDGIVAEYNVDQYLSGQIEILDLRYLTRLSYGALPALERLDETMRMYDWSEVTLEETLNAKKNQAAQACATWKNWNMSAWLTTNQG